MAPLIVLVVGFILLRLLGLAAVPWLDGWVPSLRGALAAMFLLTASAHFGRRRGDLVRMVPPRFGHAPALVTLTGVLEVLGAAGLFVPALAPWAALGLALLLLAMFPANVHAARAGLSIAGKRVTPLLPRTLMQAAFLAAVLLAGFSA